MPGVPNNPVPKPTRDTRRGGTRRRYRTCRKADQSLLNQVMERSLSRDVLTRAARALDILEGNVVLFEGEEEMPILFDFAMHDLRSRGKNAFERYRDTVGPASPLEAEILDAHAAATTSLFEVISTSPTDDTVLVDDVLVERDDVRITDVQLSRSAVPGMLLFLRPVVTAEFTITSGMMLAFPSSLVLDVLAGYRRRSRRPIAERDPRQRFLYFYRLHLAFGVGVGYR